MTGNNKKKNFFDNEEHDRRARELQEQRGNQFQFLPFQAEQKADLELALSLQERYEQEEESSLESQDLADADEEEEEEEEEDEREKKISKPALPDKVVKKEKRANEKNIASKIAGRAYFKIIFHALKTSCLDKFSRLFGKKKNKTASVAGKKEQPSKKEACKSEENRLKNNTDDIVQQENQITNPFFLQIEKLTDYEIISFDHNIEGGGIHVCTDAQRESQPEINTDYEAESIFTGRFMNDSFFSLCKIVFKLLNLIVL